MLLPIMIFGNPILRKKAAPVTDFTEELAILAQNMLETMDLAYGIGLAATQIGRDLRMFILRNYVVQEDGTVHLTEPQVYINPTITILDDRMQEDEEGCLSIPKLKGSVVRPFFIRVEALDLNGNTFTEEVEGYKARVIMHENDHINGVLFIDRLPPDEKKKLEPDLQAIKKQYKEHDFVRVLQK